MEQCLEEVYPEANTLDRYSALLLMAQDASLWDSPCAGPNWALLGDAAGQVHPVTGEGIISYTLWSAELLAEAFRQGDPLAYKGLWEGHYGRGFMAASSMLGPADQHTGAYGIIFQVAMAMTLPAVNRRPLG